MKEKDGNKISRRDFAQRAMILSATATLVPAGMTLEQPIHAALPGQTPPNLPKLSPASQAEADARFQQILTLNGSQFDDAQKAMIKTLCIFVQPTLDHVRSYPLENGEGPALYLKPLVEREKSPSTVHPTASPKNS
jgi:hypothetical protein